MKDLLGGRGPTSPRYTMGCRFARFHDNHEACLTYLAEGGHPDGFMDELETHVRTLEDSMGKKLGDPSDPLLVSVRSGAKFSMPGMMDTVLNLGLNEGSLKGLTERSGGDERFARDAYRRFIQMFGKIVMDVPAGAFEDALDAAKEGEGPERAPTPTWTRTTSRRWRSEFLRSTKSTRAASSRPILASRCVGDRRCVISWNGKRAIDYRRQNKISDDLGTRERESMVSATGGTTPGTAWRSHATRPQGSRSLRRLLGQRPRRGRGGRHRNTLPLADLERVDADSYRGLRM